MNHFRISSLFVIVMCLLCAANWVRADDAAPSPLLPDAVKLIAAADSDLAEIEAKAAKQKRDVYASLIPKLVKAQETATKAGKLEAATAAKAKVDEYKAKVESMKADSPAAKVVSTSKDVILYSQPGFKGPGVVIKQFDTVTNVQTVRFPNDALRSVRLPPGYSLIVYSSEQAGGSSFDISEECADLTGTLATEMSSFTVHKPTK